MGKIPADHPMVRAGFMSEATVREVWQFSDSYFREWLRDNNVPHRMIAGERWFHEDSLVAWFNEPFAQPSTFAGLDKLLAVLATLAEGGLNQPPAANQDEPSDDPLWTPTRVAQHLSITTATLRTYSRRYSMRSLGNGKARRYRRSEVERVMAMRESGA